jgi:hypothetical protein
MGNDLISRSELTKAMFQYVKGEKTIGQIIDEQPTAYDMDKVVKEIQTYEASEFVRRCYDENLIYKDAAIDIVKRGGIE